MYVWRLCVQFTEPQSVTVLCCFFVQTVSLQWKAEDYRHVLATREVIGVIVVPN
jgi:hypothetical protein